MPSLRDFHSFRGQLVVVFLGLFGVILATCFLVVVAAAVRASARQEINEELRLAATADEATTRSVLENHRARIEADVLLLLTPDGGIAADTRDPGRPRRDVPSTTGCWPIPRSPIDPYKER